MRNFAINLRTFLLALVLAIAVWISAVKAADPDEVHAPITVPVEIVGKDNSLVMTNKVPATIEVTLRAPQSVWERLTAQGNSIRAFLDLSGLSAGEHVVNIKVQVTVRPTQTVLINPTVATVILEPFATQTLHINLSLSGQSATGYRAGDAVLDPSEVTISGPKSLVDKAKRARVQVNLGGTRESLDEAIPIEILDEKNAPLLDGITISPQTVHVNVPISQQGGFRDVAVKVVVQGQQAPGYRLENISVFPPVVTVFASDPQLIKNISGVVETQPLDITDAKDKITTRLGLNLPDNITIVGAQTVQVEVGISPIQTSVTLTNQPISITGLSEGMIAQISPQTVDVILSGPLPVLDILTPQDVTISVDVTGLGIGIHQLTPKVHTLVDNVLVESILPGTIEVVLSQPATPSSTPKP
jgi:YbbR domain-containing protein